MNVVMTTLFGLEGLVADELRFARLRVVAMEFELARRCFRLGDGWIEKSLLNCVEGHTNSSRKH